MGHTHPVSRSRALQSGLVGVGLLGAVGISLGLASSTQASSGGGAHHHQHAAGGTSPRARHTSGRTSSGRAGHSSTSPSPKPRVTAPKPAPTQATSSGS